MPALAPTGNHFIVCGDGPLAHRIAYELTSRYDEEVVVILPDRSKNHGPQVSALSGVTVLERPELTSETFTEAGVTSARALALVREDDLGNFHAGLRAQELNPDLRLVVAIFNTSLGERIRTFFTDCAVLSESAMAAPSFVAAALSEPTPSHVRLAGRTLYVARRDHAGPGHVICGVAPGADGGSPRLTAPQDASSGLVLAVADGTPRNPLARPRRHPLRAATRMFRMLFWHRFGVAFACLIAVLGVGFVLLTMVPRYTTGDAVYLTFLDAAGAAVTGPQVTTPE